jgi:hypothetical protein
LVISCPGQREVCERCALCHTILGGPHPMREY